MQICIFEDSNVLNFEPFSLYRPVFELVCGFQTLREKIIRYFPKASYSVICREDLAEIIRQRNPGLLVNKFVDDEYLLLNGAILADKNLAEQVNAKKKGEYLFINENDLIGAKISGKRLDQLQSRGKLIPQISSFQDIRTEKVDCELLKYSFELIKKNQDQLLADFAYINKKSKKEKIGKYPGVHLVEKDQIIIGEGAAIKPGVVIDASGGPVMIGKNAVIYPNAVIEGPVSIGESAIIKSCSTIYSNVTIGRVCKVGGEIEDTIMLDYSNKQHSGFIGHSYIGSWVNLGADTNCSDLKNNYSPVKLKLSSGEVDTGMQFLGLLIGDHSKTAINTMFNTGTVAGFSSNIFGSGFPEKYIPSFSWGGSDGFIEYDLEKSINTAKVVFGRRSVPFTETEKNLFRTIFNNTRRERLYKEVIK